MDEIDSQSIKDKIVKKLINPIANFEHRKTSSDVEFSDKQIMLEQYKLLIDSAHKVDERRGGSNNFFVSINTIFVSFVLVDPFKFQVLEIKHIPLLELLMLVGIIIVWDWSRILNSYKKLNYVNYLLIKALEMQLPTFVFSLRGEIEAEQEDKKSSDKSNIILIKENILPKTFLFIYIIYFLMILVLPFFR